MTREDILAMEPGRELDALVAEKVMGWYNLSPIDTRYDWSVGVGGQRRNYGCNPMSDKAEEPIHFYSTDISAAMEVANMFEVVKLYRYNVITNGKWEASFIPNDFELNHTVYAETAPLAICKAALLAVME